MNPFMAAGAAVMKGMINGSALRIGVDTVLC